MPNEQFTLLEATPQTIANLNRLKSISPHLNLGATEMSSGNNSGIIFPQATGSARPIGEFDVRLEYIEEEVDDGEGSTTTQQVPYVHVVDSSHTMADGSPYPYAGRVYYGTNNKLVDAVFIKPTQSGYLLLNFDYITGDYSWEISYSGYFPSATPYTTYRILFADVIVYSNGTVVINRYSLNDLSYFHHTTVGPITLPLVNQYRGYFRIYYHTVTDSETGVKNKQIDVGDGYFMANGQMEHQAAATSSDWMLTSNGTRHLFLHYHQELDENDHLVKSSSIEIKSDSYQAQDPTNADAYYYLGFISYSSGLIAIQQYSYGTPVLFTVTGECGSRG